MELATAFLRHKSFDRLIKFEKGKVTGRIATIQKRHNASKSLPFETVKTVDSCVWNVKSDSEPNKYTVHQMSEECSENCGMRCKECNISVYIYILVHVQTPSCSIPFVSMCTWLHSKNQSQMVSWQASMV